MFCCFVETTTMSETEIATLRKQLKEKTALLKQLQDEEIIPFLESCVHCFKSFDKRLSCIEQNMKREDYMKNGAPYPAPKTHQHTEAMEAADALNKVLEQRCEAASANENSMAAPSIGCYSWKKIAEEEAETLIAQMSQNKPAPALPPIVPKSDNHRPPEPWYDNC